MSTNINAALAQMNPKVGGKVPVQYKIQVNNTPPQPLSQLPSRSTSHNLHQQVRHILMAHQNQNSLKIDKPQQFGFDNQKPKIERDSSNKKMTALDSHFTNNNIENDVYEFRINNFITNAKNGKILNADFIRDNDKARVLAELKNHFYN